MAVYELAARSECGIRVRLLWDSVRNQVLLRYRDTTNGDRFFAEVPNAAALSAFRHPNAYRPPAAA
jgi:hypothetical protein